MGITVSILFIAAGAIMRWAVTATTDGFNIHTAGMILFIIGIAGAVASLAFWSSWGGIPTRGGVIVDDRVAAVRRATPVVDDRVAGHTTHLVEDRTVERVPVSSPAVEDRVVEERF